MAIVILWIRSYWRYDWLGGMSLKETRPNEFQWKDGCLIDSANGVLVMLYAGNVWERTLSLSQFTRSWASPHLRVTGDEGESAWNGFRAKVYPSGVFRGSVPHWFSALLMAMAATAPWIKWRFSLRTLLIATTLVAVVLGLAVAMR
jgi:hypothetical protein